MKLARFFALILIFAASSLYATTHVITFAGISYTPNDITVAVGDTIEWRGDFGTHPLKSAPPPGFPAGAAPFANSSGTVFRYPVTVPGDHGYYCEVHVGAGMVGVFRATAAEVKEDAPNIALQAYPNPASRQLTLSYTLENSSKVRISLFDMSGRELYQLENAGTPGPNTAYVNVAALPVGTYYYRLETSKAILARKLTISR